MVDKTEWKPPLPLHFVPDAFVCGWTRLIQHSCNRSCGGGEAAGRHLFYLSAASGAPPRAVGLGPTTEGWEAMPRQVLPFGNGCTLEDRQPCLMGAVGSRPLQRAKP